MKKYLILIFGAFLIALSPLPTTVVNDAQAEAQATGYSIIDAGIQKPPSLPGTTTFTTTEINNYIYYLVGALVTLSAALAVFFIYQGGFQYASSMGSDESIGKAKKTIMWAVLGLLLVIISYQIVVTIITMTFEATPPPPSP